MDEHRKRNLEMAFRGVTDEELIEELRRRKRFLRVDSRQTYHVEHAGCAGYLDHLDRDLCAMLVCELNNRLAVRFEDVPAHCENGLFHGTVLRQTHIDVLVDGVVVEADEEEMCDAQ